MMFIKYSLVPLCLLVSNWITLTSAIDHKEHQRYKLFLAERRCIELMRNTPYPTTGIHCNVTFDNVMCWPHTPAGTVLSQPCPAYIKFFLTSEFATRGCNEDGTWFHNPSVNRTWTNMTACMPSNVPQPSHAKDVHPLIKEHIHTIVFIARLGYSISLAVLVIAIIPILVFKRLHCQRNIVHANLFFSFALRAGLCLLKETIQGTGVVMHYNETGTQEVDEGTHWECKLLFTLLHYVLGANYMWILVEGLYLHTLIILAVFSHKRVFKWYIIFGWLSPLLFVIPWVFVRIFLNNTLCWNTHEGGYYWIQKVPIIASIFVNFFFFINIIRVLFTKLMANNSRDPRRYRKLAKSTLILIPLFGVHYIIFIVIPDELEPSIGVIKLYMETVLNSFQGVVVAFLFCFLNGEVRQEITKNWVRHRLQSDYGLTYSRTSRAFSTTSFLARGRGSLTTQTNGLNEVHVGQCNSLTPSAVFGGSESEHPHVCDSSVTQTGSEPTCMGRKRTNESLQETSAVSLSNVSEESEENASMMLENGVS